MVSRHERWGWDRWWDPVSLYLYQIAVIADIKLSQVRSLVHSIYMDIGAGSQITFFSITGPQQWQNLGKKWRRAHRFLLADSEDDRKPEAPLSTWSCWRWACGVRAGARWPPSPCTGRTAAPGPGQSEVSSVVTWPASTNHSSPGSRCGTCPGRGSPAPRRSCWRGGGRPGLWCWPPAARCWGTPAPCCWSASAPPGGPPTQCPGLPRSWIENKSSCNYDIT